MLDAGVPSRAIMEVLGHSGFSVTLNTYAYVLPALRQEAADAQAISPLSVLTRVLRMTF